MQELSKAELRSTVLAILPKLKPSERAIGEEVVGLGVQGTPEWARARTILLYAAKAPEFSVTHLLNACLRTGRSMVLPKVTGDGEMEPRRVLSFDHLKPGKFGILEPLDSCELVSFSEIELAIIPGVAFDLLGNRLGRGGGYYDRILGALTCPKFGVCFDQQVVELVPTEDHDQKVDQIWYPKRVLG